MTLQIEAGIPRKKSGGPAADKELYDILLDGMGKMEVGNSFVAHTPRTEDWETKPGPGLPCTQYYVRRIAKQLGIKIRIDNFSDEESVHGWYRVHRVAPKEVEV